MNMVNKRRICEPLPGNTTLAQVHRRFMNLATLDPSRQIAELGNINVRWEPRVDGPFGGVFVASMDVSYTVPDAEPNIERGAE